MKPPKRIQVGPFTYTVTCDRQAMNARCRNEGADLLGSTEHRSLTIDVEPEQHEAQQRDTLLHETLHCIFEMTGIANAWSAETVEDTIRRLSPSLLDVLRRNPKFVAFLVED